MIRDLEFTQELDVAILSERRVIPPYGMHGGEPGAVGKTYWLKKTSSKSSTKDKGKEAKTHTKISLGGKNQVRMKAGDHIVVHTPGGGGYGVPGTVDDRLDDDVYRHSLGAPTRANGSLAAMTAAAWSN